VFAAGRARAYGNGITTLRDSAGPIDLSGGMATGRQSDIGANTSRSLEARRIIDRRLEAERGDRTYKGL
jgi:hypothetical protein